MGPGKRDERWRDRPLLLEKPLSEQAVGSGEVGTDAPDVLLRVDLARDRPLVIVARQWTIKHRGGPILQQVCALRRNQIGGNLIIGERQCAHPRASRAGQRIVELRGPVGKIPLLLLGRGDLGEAERRNHPPASLVAGKEKRPVFSLITGKCNRPTDCKSKLVLLERILQEQTRGRGLQGLATGAEG